MAICRADLDQTDMSHSGDGVYLAEAGRQAHIHIFKFIDSIVQPQMKKTSLNIYTVGSV